MLSNPPNTAKTPPRRSLLVTLLAWTIIGLSGLMLPISGITLLMFLAKSYGTASATLTGFLGIVVLPSVVFAAGIGLLCRRAWAWYGLLLLLSSLVAYNVWALLLAPPEMTITTTANGVQTFTPTDFRSQFYNVPFLALCSAMLLTLLSRPARAECGILRESNAVA